MIDLYLDLISTDIQFTNTQHSSPHQNYRFPNPAPPGYFHPSLSFLPMRQHAIAAGLSGISPKCYGPKASPSHGDTLWQLRHMACSITSDHVITPLHQGWKVHPFPAHCFILSAPCRGLLHSRMLR